MTSADIIQTTVPNWVYLISLVYTVPGELKIKPSYLKVGMCLVGFLGVFLLIKAGNDQDSSMLFGNLDNVLNSLCYGLYAVVLSTVAGDGDDFDYCLFLGFVGLINIVCLAPVMVVVHYLGFQEFTMPPLPALAS